MKKNETKVTNLVATKVAEQLEGIKNSETTKASASKAKKTKKEVKYVYPADVVDTLARKKWRQQTRNELHRLELAMARIKDQNSKEFKAAAKAYDDFKKKVLKPEQVA